MPSEREQIVKWLRGQKDNCTGGTDYRSGFNAALRYFSDAIERGDHLSEQGEGYERGSQRPQ